MSLADAELAARLGMQSQSAPAARNNGATRGDPRSDATLVRHSNDW